MTGNHSDRYGHMQYRRSGRSGLKLPAISLGLWQNFGGDTPFERQRAIVRRAFDLGITHFDLANNYGPPYGSAESNFGQMLRTDLAGHRDELFRIYEKHLKTADARAGMDELATLAKGRRLCLLCYERDPDGCHRRRVAELLHERTGAKVEHLFCAPV